MFDALLLLIALTSLQSKQGGAEYLIITHDSFYDVVTPLAEWKHKKGLETRVAKLSETGSSESQIKNYIQTAYNTWNPRPEYVLLVGDVEFVPTYYSGETPTDNYYATLAGGDYLSDVCLGRFSVDNVSECSTMVAKTLGYERTPWMVDDKWFQKTTLLIRDDYDDGDLLWYYPDIWYAHNLLNQHGYLEIDTIFAKNGNNAGDIIRSINKGRGFVGYRGCAGKDWHQPFDIEPYVTENGWQLPVVVSVTCNTGSFQEDGFLCERFTRAGTPAEPKGAVAFLGTNTVNTSEPRSIMWRGFWQALFTDSIFTLGKTYVAMKLHFFNSSWDERREYEGWHLFGDPELNLWTSVPEILEVSYLHAIPAGACNFDVRVTSNANPVTDALVCLYKKDEVYERGCTDAQGKITLSINPTTADTMRVTVTGHNCKPYEGYVVVISGGAYVYLLKHAIIDTGNGNSDGFANPGETIVMPVWVMNYGMATASGVAGTLSALDTLVNITDNSENFGNVSVSDSAKSLGYYEFTIVPTCPDKHVLNFNLVCTDAVPDTWASPFAIDVVSPTLSINNHTVDDVSQPTPNGAIDPGETVDLIIELKNSGSVSAKGVSAVLCTDDGYVTISDSFSVYDSIPGDSMKSNSADPYILTCSPSTPLYHRIDFSLDISCYGGFKTALDFTLKVGLGGDYLVWDPDYHHKSGPIVDSLLQVNGYVGDYTIELVKHRPYLSEYKAIFVCLGVPYYDYTIRPGGDDEALCSYLDEGGRIYMEGANAWASEESTEVQDYFRLKLNSDGYADADSILGMPGTIASGMCFAYSGENQSMDRIKPRMGAWSLFENSSPGYINGVAFDYGWHKRKTIGTTFEIGGLIDGVSTRETLVDSIMKWFLRDPMCDVALWRIREPENYVVPPYVGFSPSVTAKNIGASTVNFNVICRIDSLSQGVFGDTVNLSLDSRDWEAVVFRRWTPSATGNTYNIQCWTELANDGEPQNNYRSMEVTSFLFDDYVRSGYTLVIPVLDGFIDTMYEWEKATRLDISDVLNKGGKGPFPAKSVDLHVMNNDTCVFFGFDMWWDESLDDNDFFILYCDDNRDLRYPAWPDSSEGWPLYVHHALWEWVSFRSVTRDSGNLRRFEVTMEGKSGVTAGHVQHEFIFPLRGPGDPPEYLDALPGDTVGIGILAGNLEQWDLYGWWPQHSWEVHEPPQMGKLIIATSSGVEIAGDNLPRVYGVSQNRPNPFAVKSRISYQLPVKSDVSFKIYNNAGQLVKTLVDKVEEPGYKSVVWKGKNDRGRMVGAGIYFYRFEANSVKGRKQFVDVKKMLFFGKRQI